MRDKDLRSKSRIEDGESSYTVDGSGEEGTSGQGSGKEEGGFVGGGVCEVSGPQLDRC